MARPIKDGRELISSLVVFSFCLAFTTDSLCGSHRVGRLGAIALTTVLLLGACTETPVPGEELALPGVFSASGIAATPDRWWRSFGDSRLNQLEERALVGNFSLASSWQRLRQAQARVDRESASLFPDLTASAESRINRGGDPNPNQAPLGLGLGLGISANYEVDLWGRIRSEVAAEQDRARASLADYRTAALTLSAEVARTWYALLAAREQRDLIGRQIGTNQKILDQLKVRLGEGQGRSVDVLRQQGLVRATREQEAAVESDLAVLANRLAVLQGQAPDGSPGPTGENLPDLPPPPRTGRPVLLIQRRPDLLRASYEIRASDADLAAALRDRLPRLNLNFSSKSRGRNGAIFFPRSSPWDGFVRLARSSSVRAFAAR